MSKIKGRPPKGIRVGRPRKPYTRKAKSKPKVLPFEEVRAIIYNAGIGSIWALLKFKRRGVLSKKLHRSLDLEYNYPNEFTNYEDFFSHKPPKYLNYEQAKRLVNLNNIITMKQYHTFAKRYNVGKKIGKLFPRYHYHEEYIKGCNSNWDLFFNITRKIYLPFEEARAIVHNMKLKNVEQWKRFTLDPNFPKRLPKYPETTYHQFTTYSNWLGNNVIDILDVRDEYTGLWAILHQNGDPENLMILKHFPIGYSLVQEWCATNDYTVVKLYHHERLLKDKVNEIIMNNSSSFKQEEFLTTNFNILRYQLDNILLSYHPMNIDD